MHIDKSSCSRSCASRARTSTFKNDSGAAGQSRHNEHAAQLERLGLDPGKLAERAAERAVSA